MFRFNAARFRNFEFSYFSFSYDFVATLETSPVVSPTTSSVLQDADNVSTTGADVTTGANGPTTETSPVVVSFTSQAPDSLTFCE